MQKTYNEPPLGENEHKNTKTPNHRKQAVKNRQYATINYNCTAFLKGNQNYMTEMVSK